MGRRLADIRYRVVRVADPGANTEISISSTGASFWLVRSLVATLTTDATVADRTVRIEQSDGTSTYFVASAGEVQAASLTRRYGAHPGADGSLTAGGVRGIPLDAYGLVVPPGHVVRTDTENLQAGDEYSDIALHVLEFETGRIAPGVPTVNIYVEAFDPTSTL